MVGGSGNNVLVFSREQGLRRDLENLFLRYHGSICFFSTRRACLRGLSASFCELLIIDCDGCPAEELGLLAELRQIRRWVPAIVLVEAGDIPKAVRAMRLGALDCIEKPVREDLLRAAIESGLGRGRQYAVALKALTKTETRVLQLILAGETTSRIADLVHRSARTVEVHRRNILRKLHIHSTPELVRWAMTSGAIRLVEPGPARG